MSKIITCEQVSNGHPDKICDQIADAIVTDILQHDRHARVAIECLLKKSQLFIAGEVTTDYRPNYNQIVHDVFNRIGAEKLGWNLTELLRIGILVDKQSPDIAMGVDKGGAGDQGIMYGYATNETAEQMPIPYMVATKFLQLLKNHPSKMFRADAKAQVSYDYDTGRITTFLCSVQHSPDVEVSDFRHIIESMMVLAACEYGLDGDFTKLVNPTGRFVLGGSYADCGVTGRKLACDTYGGIGRMGGGALSGKDPTKVDRSAAYMARKIAKDIVQAGYADKCEVQLAYAIGVVQPVGVSVECFGTEHQSLDFIEAYVHDSYDLTPQGIIKRLGFTVVPFGQGFKDMSPPTKEFYKLLMEGRIIHGGNPVMAWMAGNVVVDTDPAGNIKPTKAKSPEKIDGIVAAIMALDRCIRNEGQQQGSVYDERDMIVF